MGLLVAVRQSFSTERLGCKMTQLHRSVGDRSDDEEFLHRCIEAGAVAEWRCEITWAMLNS
jgi:hypothetical protein